MKTSTKCEICNSEVSADSCVFATQSKVIDGKRYTFCCSTALRKFMLSRATKNREDSKGKQK